MNLKRVMFISGVFLISLLFLLFFLENKITGKITYDPSEFNVCNNVQQLDLWSNTFEVSGGDATTFDEVVVAPDICDEYLMYKQVGGVAHYLIVEKVGGHYVINAGYLNLTAESYFVPPSNFSDYVASSGASITNAMDDLGGPAAFFSLFENISDGNAAKTFLDSKFEITNSSEYLMVFDGSWGFGEVEFNNVGQINKSLAMAVGGVPYGAAFMYVFFNISDEVTSPTPTINFTSDIPNQNFSKNSDWNAINIQSYLGGVDLGGLPEDSIFWADKGVGNSNGEKIEVNISGYVVSFKPALDYVGSLNFRLETVNGSQSNIFVITIVETTGLNESPQLNEVIPNVTLELGVATVIDLSLYFSDPEGDTITYSTSDQFEGINFTFNGSLMTIYFAENYSGDEVSFRINASDGNMVWQSHNISLFVGGGVNDTDDSGGVVNDTDDSGGGGEGLFGFSLMRWIIIILSIILGFFIIGAIIYFIKFRSKPSAPKISPRVRDYLGKLNSKRVGGARVASKVGGARVASKVGGARVASKVGRARVASKVGRARVASKVGGARVASRVGGARVASRVGGNSGPVNKKSIGMPLPKIAFLKRPGGGGVIGGKSRIVGPKKNFSGAIPSPLKKRQALSPKKPALITRVGKRIKKRNFRRLPTVLRGRVGGGARPPHKTTKKRVIKSLRKGSQIPKVIRGKT